LVFADTNIDATLGYGYIKNVSISDIGTPASDISSVIAGSDSISSTQASDSMGNFFTGFYPTDST
jgi:hypothetical protein